MTETDQDLLVSSEDGIVVATINRPQARNAFTFAMYERLAALCEALNSDSNARVLVITGAGGKAFSSGTDISQFKVFETPEDGWAYEDRIENALASIETCRVPTIAAIAGACTGGGAAIAACCDLRVTTSTLLFGFPIARTLGNCLSTKNYARLVALIGPARVKDLIFRARLVEATEAHAIGLVNEVVDSFEELMPRALALAGQIREHAPLTMQTCKEALLRLREQGVDADDRDLIATCYMSADFREGMQSFFDKRRPQWKGR
jgi:enoyl-CoA hydratase/carnithine racemase